MPNYRIEFALVTGERRQRYGYLYNVTERKAKSAANAAAKELGPHFFVWLTEIVQKEITKDVPFAT